jgi:hypothetical protein
MRAADWGSLIVIAVLLGMLQESVTEMQLLSFFDLGEPCARWGKTLVL